MPQGPSARVPLPPPTKRVGPDVKTAGPKPPAYQDGVPVSLPMPCVNGVDCPVAGVPHYKRSARFAKV